MKMKITALIMSLVVLCAMLTGCIHNDVGIKLEKDGTGSISVTIGIEKEFYDSLKELGSDPFEGKTTSEYTYDGSTYVSCTEVKKYDSYEDIEKALLEMTYDTEIFEDLEEAEDDEIGEEEDFTYGDEYITPPVYDESEAPEADTHIFSSVNIEKNSGIFYSSYTFDAVMNPQTAEDSEYNINDIFKVTLTVEMPEEITQSKGGKIEGNKVTFDIKDITESQEFVATCESNNTGVVIGIVVGLIVIVAGIFCLIKFKK